MTSQADREALRDIVMTPELRNRIRDAWASNRLSPVARDMLHILDEHGFPRVGRSNAISIAEIQGIITRSWGRDKAPSDRAIKGAVKELIEEHNIPIGSVRRTGHGFKHGYFFIISPADADAAIAPLLGEMKSIAKRIKVISPDTDYMRRVAGQLGLESKAEATDGGR